MISNPERWFATAPAPIAILRTNSSIRVQTAGNQQALATVDAEDVAAALIYYLQFRPC